tara:strand:+ start:361 stop:642 length:282 start_codon:yes stop_codon:yes gene_type:complete
MFLESYAPATMLNSAVLNSAVGKRKLTERSPAMPATSKAQQKAAGAALSAKRGETKPSELYGSSKEMYDSMSKEELEEFASTKREGKPQKKDD